MKEPTTYTVSTIAEKLGVTASTIRLNWTPEFAEFLSDRANPAKGETRVYSRDDLEVLQTVAVLRQQDKTYDDIKLQLADGIRLEFETPPNEDDTSQNEETAIVTRLAATVARFEGELTATINERDNLREKIEKEQTARLAAEIRATKAETELDILKRRRSFWQRLRGE